MRSYRNIQITLALAGIYLLPYRYFLLLVPVLVLPDVVIRVFEALFPPEARQSPDEWSRQRRRLIRTFLFGGLLVLTSGVANRIAATDVTLSVVAYCFPIAGLAAFGCLTTDHWKRFVRINAVFVYLQIPFLVYQWMNQSGTTDDWFAGSMIEYGATNIVGFVFFINTWMFYHEYRRHGRHLNTAVVSFACAVATNTHLTTLAFLISVAAYLAFRRQFRILVAATIATLVLVSVGPRLLNSITVWGTQGIEEAVGLAFSEPAWILRIGKVHGVVYGVEHLADSPLHFLFGQGPGTMASRLIYYKLEESRTTLSFLGPVSPMFAEFTNGLFMGSNLHRPYSNAAAFLLEGGVTFTIFMVFLIVGVLRRMLWQSHEGRALFVFLVGTLFIDHVMDNAKMTFLLFAWMLYLQSLSSPTASAARVPDANHLPPANRGEPPHP